MTVMMRLYSTAGGVAEEQGIGSAAGAVFSHSKASDSEAKRVREVTTRKAEVKEATMHANPSRLGESARFWAKCGQTYCLRRGGL